MNYRISTMILLVILALCKIANGQLFTIFGVSTQMSTFTRTILTSTVCVILSETPMPVCRRRGPQVEEPIFSSADEQFLIQPTNTFQVEPTEVAFSWFNSHPNSEFNLASSYAIQPSMMMPLSGFQRIPFARMNYGANDNVIANRQIITVITLTYTKMTTEIEMSTKTNTVGVSGCTPTRFPYDVCVSAILF